MASLVTLIGKVKNSTYFKRISIKWLSLTTILATIFWINLILTGETTVNLSDVLYASLFFIFAVVATSIMIFVLTYPFAYPYFKDKELRYNVASKVIIVSALIVSFVLLLNVVLPSAKNDLLTVAIVIIGLTFLADSLIGVAGSIYFWVNQVLQWINDKTITLEKDKKRILNLKITDFKKYEIILSSLFYFALALVPSLVAEIIIHFKDILATIYVNPLQYIHIFVEAIFLFVILIIFNAVLGTFIQNNKEIFLRELSAFKQNLSNLNIDKANEHISNAIRILNFLSSVHKVNIRLELGKLKQFSNYLPLLAPLDIERLTEILEDIRKSIIRKDIITMKSNVQQLGEILESTRTQIQKIPIIYVIEKIPISEKIKKAISSIITVDKIREFITLLFIFFVMFLLSTVASIISDFVTSFIHFLLLFS